MKLKNKMRSFSRKLLAPFRRLGGKIKIAGERFVVKTISKHGLASYNETANVTGQSAALNQPVLHGSIKVMLAFLQASRPASGPSAPQFEAVPVGGGRFLVRHPLVGHMFADSANLQTLPQLALNRFQELSTIALEQNCTAGANVVHLCSGQGFHTLSIAELVGSEGRVVAVDPKSPWASTLRMNLESHQFGERVSLVEAEAATELKIRQLFANHEGKKLVVVDEDADLPTAWHQNLLSLAATDPSVCVIVGANAMSMAEYARAAIFNNTKPALQPVTRLAA